MNLFKTNDNKLVISILVFISISILLINLYIINRLTEVNELQNHVINVSGKQRMLSQKMTKEILLYVYFNDNIEKQNIANTIDKFQNNLDDLTNGNESRGILTAQSDNIVEQLNNIHKIWNEYKKNIFYILNNENALSNINSNMNYIIENNNRLLKELDLLVDLYEQKSYSQIILSIQGVIVTVGSLIIFATWWIASNIIYNSGIDELTNIYNRKKFNKLLKRKINDYSQLDLDLSLVMFDIDNFKKINDEYGHSFGDKVIIEIVEIVNESIRENDIFARWGGEEFLIIIPNNNLEASVKIANRIREEIENYNFDKVETVTCSFGVVEYQKEDTINKMIKRADEALYNAKHCGRNKVRSKPNN